ncbi:MAG: hypothetical protein COW00_19925 [Bdellovibrio sp. CG12_big_fil_rev_8_21_14_0_65_39_13]|nr:MAG: hypothetical protein COW78_02100 [Bdellovibrio sp. CG22_combo_CG10-13_8_21_14_all_39_27]PIQ57643.1 MAG: hypothetical protein COW00_19925 [Bdellovibrio sp. CG12_big_fil_rev_8_21_14_0_65_39_13]PIR35807.1 MAG: hypothetical protein COV37_06305 [Bdellovibrio sp. CG11_big_fil_rev_8_21_14_0_20_39_38]PJB53514.1 MAG: hypothetical protein CO099_06660 [Bdellovibrio sp. CG_4_9_14_3_um_filter_39_7]
MFKTLILLLVLLPHIVLAEDQLVTLLEVSHSNSNKKVRYRAKIRDCKFKDVSEMTVDIYDHATGNESEPSFIESIYYNVETLFSVDEFLDFQISAVKNLRFHFEITNCQIDKYLEYNNQRYKLEEITVNYHNYLAFPTLKNVLVKVVDQQSVPQFIEIPYYNAEGYIPFYEAHVGIGFNLSENIRPRNHLKDKTTFRQGLTVHEPLPLFLIRYGPLFINKDGAGIVLLPLKNYALLFTTIIDGEPYDADGLSERERSLFSGWILKTWDLTFFWFKDIQGISHGEIFKIQLEHEYNLNRYFTLAPHMFVQWWDDEYMNYYYGVAPNEVNVVGREYNAKATQNMEIMIKGYLKMGRYKWVMAVGEKWYGKNVSASPLVRKDTEFRTIWGVTAQFL